MSERNFSRVVCFPWIVEAQKEKCQFIRAIVFDLKTHGIQGRIVNTPTSAIRGLRPPRKGLGLSVIAPYFLRLTPSDIAATL